MELFSALTSTLSTFSRLCIASNRLLSINEVLKTCSFVPSCYPARHALLTAMQHLTKLSVPSKGYKVQQRLEQLWAVDSSKSGYMLCSLIANVCLRRG